MKKKFRYLFLVLILLTISFIFGVWLRTKTEIEPAPVKPAVVQSAPRFKAIMGKALRKKETLLKSQNYSCKDDLEFLLINSVDDLKMQLANQPVTLGKECVKTLTDVGSPVINGEMQKCLQKNVMQNADSCSSLIAFLRAYLLTKEAGEKSLKERELPELIGELMWNFIQSPTPKLADLDRNLKIADELIDRDPSMYDAYKAKMVNLFVKEMNHKANVDEEFDRTVEGLKSLSEDDPEVESLPFIRQISKGNWKGVDEWADDRMNSNPEDYRGFYAKSAYYWQNKNADEAIRYMNRAVRLNPQDGDLRKTLQGLQSRDYNLQHYQMKMGFKFDDF
ncbi:MAG: tetratricopeptide repeat protein [Bacteriovoracaceae bacterium]